MKNIHVLPTDKPSRLGKFIDTNNLFLRTSNDIPRGENVHIYITDDEEIKEGDWILWEGKVVKSINTSYCDVKKIILTTDKDLIADGVQAIDDTFLEWFVNNPSCESVEIEEGVRYEDEWIDNEDGGEIFQHQYCCYKIIIPNEEPDYTALLKPVGTKQETTLEEIEQQIALTEIRGMKVVKYLDKYKGQNIYNEIALAIEFGYQLKLEEDE